KPAPTCMDELFGKGRVRPRADSDSTISSTPVSRRLALLDDLRLEACLPIPRHLDLDRTDIGQHGLGPHPLPAVAPAGARRVVLLIAEVVGDLALQGGLQHPFGQLLEQPALAGQLEPARAGPLYQLPDQLLVQNIRRQLDRPDLFNRLSRGSYVAHQVLL